MRSPSVIGLLLPIALLLPLRCPAQSSAQTDDMSQLRDQIRAQQKQLDEQRQALDSAEKALARAQAAIDSQQKLLDRLVAAAALPAAEPKRPTPVAEAEAND